MHKYIMSLAVLCMSGVLVARDLLIENKLDKPVKVAYLFVGGYRTPRSSFDTGDFVEVAAGGTKIISVAEQPKDKPSPQWQRYLIATTEQQVDHLKSMSNPLGYVWQQDKKAWANIDSHKETKLTIQADSKGILKLIPGKISEKDGKDAWHSFFI